jgi:hypothetical protein
MKGAVMKSQALNDSHHSNESGSRDDGRLLRMDWFIALVALWIVIWMFVGTSGLMPRWLWATILGLLTLAGFAIALFAPRANPSRKRR